MVLPRELRTAQDPTERHVHRVRPAMNAGSAAKTALALAVILATKFAEAIGSW
jgi:hypothetical protein